MRYLLIVVFCVSLYALQHKTDISYNYISYDDFKNENLFSGETKLEYENDYFLLNIKLEYLYSSEYSKKRYFDINELYFIKEFSNSTINFGKQIKYWGELEGYNVADIFNKKRYLFDPFDKDKKIGSYTLNSIFYFETSSLEVGTKLYEEDIKYPKSDDPYYPFSLEYSDDLQTSDSRYTPSFYLKYGFTTEEIESENRLILWHGYDSKRGMILDNLTLKQKAYRATKLLYLMNMLYKDYIFKMEMVGTDVEDGFLSDYAQLSFGVEKGIYDIQGNDLTLYLEYYKYKYFEDGVKNIDISEVYNDDLFLALKLNLNDVDTTELKTGILFDTQNSEKVIKTELRRRISDGLIFNAELLNIEAKKQSVLTPFGDSTRIMLGLTYSF